MEIFVRFLFTFKMMNKIFYFFSLIFLCFQISITQANTGNKKIESFSKSKTFLKKIHQESRVTFYCQCKYNNNKPNWESCGFHPRKDKKRASRIEWEHILPASYFGKKFNAWVNGHPNCINNKGKKFKGRKCGEHGGDPKSIQLCSKIGLNYVSCSPYRVPIARLAAAQAELMK